MNERGGPERREERILDGKALLLDAEASLPICLAPG